MRLGYTILYVPDPTASAAFYEAAFGLAVRFVHESGYAELETGATTLAFASHELARSNGVTFSPGRAAMEVALVTADVSAALGRAIHAGAELVASPKQKPWGQTVAYVRDNAGFLVELCTPVESPA